MVTITADQFKALHKLLTKVGIETFVLQMDGNDNLYVEAYKGDTRARVTINSYGRPVQNEVDAASG